LISKPLAVTDVSDSKVTNNDLLLEMTSPGNMLPQKTASSGDELSAPS